MVFSSLDATQGFLQPELDSASSRMTTITTPFGRYKFLRLPFGISSASEVFHHTVSEIFSDIEGVETFVDDLLVHAPTKANHDTILQKVLARCQSVNLKQNLVTCRFEFKYWRHIIRQGVIKPDPPKIEAIVNMPEPKGTDGFHRLLGMATYLRKFCPNLSEVRAPLRDLTRKGISWEWGKIHDVSLKRLRSTFSSNQTLQMFDPSKPITLSVDSSRMVLGMPYYKTNSPLSFPAVV